MHWRHSTAPLLLKMRIARRPRADLRVTILKPWSHCLVEEPVMDKLARTTTKAETHANRDASQRVSRDELIALLNDDLAREYQAVIAYVVYSQTLKGAAYMAIAAELEQHAKQELAHALTIAKQIDYLGGNPTVTPKVVKRSESAQEMLQFDLENETETIRHYRDRVRQCESLGEFAMAEQIRQILVNEQEHQIDLATALGVVVPESALGART